MKDKIDCIDEESIAEAMELDPTHPIRVHIAGCARCSALARLYAAFVEQEPVGDDDGASARRELSKAVAALAQQAETERGTARHDPNVRRREDRPRWAFVLGWRPLVAVAVVVVGAAVVWFGLQDRSSPGGFTRIGDAVRTPMEVDDAPQPYPASVVESAEAGGAVALRLSWSPVTGADGYQIEVRDTSLELVLTTNTVTDTSYVLSKDALPAGESRTFYWRVIVMRGGDATARSRAMRLDWPVGSARE